MIKEIKLPEIAENITTAVVIEILVKKGDKVQKDDSLAEMESDKASFELPSDVSGTIKEIKVANDDEVEVGQVMFTVETEEEDKAEEEDKVEAEAEVEVEKEDKDEAEDEAEVEEEDKAEVEAEKEDEGKSRKDVPASPAVRRVAREIGVDIGRVKGSGPNNRITEDDVKAYAKKAMQKKSSPAADDYDLPDFSHWGKTRREKMDNIRKIIAKNMSESWQSIPHVFQFDKADVTELEKFRKDYSKYVEKEGAKLTVTAILLKITAIALKTFPRFNASLDMKNGEIIYKEYVNIGVAVDTEKGLLVPVIRDADKKSIMELSIELNEMAEKARNKKIKPDELQGGNFAISNLGGIGGTNFTPIVYRPNVAILGVSRSQTEAVFIDGEFKPRMMLPLSLSYDHRIIDGAEGARFLRWLCDAMERPILTMFK